MFQLPTRLLALIAIVSALPAAPNTISPRASDTISAAYELIADYSDRQFFDHFTTFTGPDPTNGHVNYTDLATAAETQLVGFWLNETSNTTSAYIGVDNTNLAPVGRNSVRLISKQTFNAGSLAIIDVRHVPTEYGVWPAIWMLGSQGTWPSSGEIDIIEGVHDFKYNAMTLHTAAGCNIDNGTAQQGQLLSANCNAGNAATGCSVAAYNQSKVTGPGGTSSRVFATAGSSFNEQGGGVYAHEWQADGITVWMFPREDIPTDVLAGAPKPSTWTQKPLAKFTGSGCDFSAAFKDMQLIINIDFCGDWAGKVWESTGAANATGVSTCDDYVANNPEAFDDTYFTIDSIRFYANNGQKPGNGPTFGKRDEETSGESIEYSVFA